LLHDHKAHQTALTGASKRGLTFDHQLDSGTAPSRENAYSVLQQHAGNATADQNSKSSGSQMVKHAANHRQADAERWCRQLQHSGSYVQHKAEIPQAAAGRATVDNSIFTAPYRAAHAAAHAVSSSKYHPLLITVLCWGMRPHLALPVQALEVLVMDAWCSFGHMGGFVLLAALCWPNQSCLLDKR
jgi:hypothetical protein